MFGAQQLLESQRHKYIYNPCQKYQIGHNSVQRDMNLHANSYGRLGNNSKETVF